MINHGEGEVEAVRVTKFGSVYGLRWVLSSESKQINTIRTGKRGRSGLDNPIPKREVRRKERKVGEVKRR